MPPHSPLHHQGFRPLATLLACLLPGLGHYSIGEKKRAGFIALGVLGLFFAGLLIGGIDVVDRRDDPVWFAGQVLVGPVALGVDYLHQSRLKVVGKPHAFPGGPNPDKPILRAAYPDESRAPDGRAQPGGTPPYRRSLGKIHEIGTLYAAIAGMLNLIAIIDVAYARARATGSPA